MCVSCSVVSDSFVTTVAHQVPLSMGFSLNNTGVGCHFLLQMNKASGSDGIPVELFQILKDDAVKVMHSIYQQIWETQQWSQYWKNISLHSNPKEG